MEIVRIGFDQYLNKDIKKIKYTSPEFPKVQLFNSKDAVSGNPLSNVALAFVYVWPEDNAPESVASFFNKISNYTALTGFWRTTNGARYIFSNILANPNINKIIVVVFGRKDNGHLLVDALTNFWQNGLNDNGIIINSNAANPKFEQVPNDALARLKTQTDLIVLRNIPETDSGFADVENIVKACIQEPVNAVPVAGTEFYSTVISNDLIYDDGARFDEPYYIDLSKQAKNVCFEEKNILPALGKSIQAQNLVDAADQLASFIFQNGTAIADQRGILTVECRSISITIIDVLEKIPDNFSREYIQKYVGEFMNGLGSGNSDFAYTYHERIFKKWGNQVERAITFLKKNLANNSRRALISLWDPASDIENPSSPCLDFIWCAVRDNKLEFHVVYRSHHLVTITESGKLMPGEGALIPNLFAIGTLQQFMADTLNIKRGPLVLTDFSGHVYVNKVL